MHAAGAVETQTRYWLCASGPKAFVAPMARVAALPAIVGPNADAFADLRLNLDARLCDKTVRCLDDA